MGSLFGSYSIATSGMKVSQTALTVTSHNLANVGTSGFSRQQISMAEQCIGVAAGVSEGIGSRVADINRVRSQFLDQNYRQQSAKEGYWKAKAANFEDIQLVLNEFTADGEGDDSGLSTVVQEFFSSWDELAKDPSGLSTRQNVLEKGQALVEILAGIDRQLLRLQQDAAANAIEGVAQLNELAGQVAKLNVAIVQAEASGSEASDLRDSRDSIVDQMAALADLTVQEQAGGMLTVSIGGVSLVKGDAIRTLETSGDGTTERPLQITWSGLGSPLVLSSGSLLANWEDADQSSFTAITETDIPYAFDVSSQSSIGNLRQALNGWVTTLALEVNSLHRSGQGLDGSTGLDFFVASTDGQPLSISNIAINTILKDPNKIAAAASDAAGDNWIATAIGMLLDEDYFLKDSLALNGSSFYQNIISWLGIAGNNANSYYETQSNLVQQVESRRQSLSAVSIDEEMTKLVIYQNAYNASARILSLIDGLVKELINELG